MRQRNSFPKSLMVHDHMQYYEVSPYDVKIHEELCQSVGKSRQRYQEYLEEQKKQKQQTEKDFLKNYRRRSQGYSKEKKGF